MKYIIPTVLGSAALVAAHGFVDSAVIGGETYEFYQPYTDPYMSPAPDRVSRFIAGNGPVRDVTSADMTCGGDGSGSQPAALHAPAAAGSTVELTWTLWPDSHVGPVMTYMARCPDAGCQDYQPGSDAVWFKIQEGGREGVTNNWAATPLMSAGGVAEYTIPECLAPGFYLVRHEIIALHQEAEYYPGCHQLEVTGSGSTVPSGLVSFPGAYAESDAGIAYSPYQQSEEYEIPGPALFTCGGSPAPPAPTTAAPVPSAPATTAAPVPSATSAPAPVEEDDEEEIIEDDCPVEDDEEEEDEEELEEDDCPVEDEDEEEEGLSPVNEDEDDLEEDDCPVEEEEEEEELEEDDCPVEDDEEEEEEEEVEEDDCPVEDDEEEEEEEEEELEEDDCPVEEEEEEEEELEEGDDDEYEEIEECETVPVKRQTLHERRLN